MERIRRSAEKRAKREYFLKQRLYGILIILLGVIGGTILILASHDIRNLVPAAFVLLLGAYMTVTEKMILVDDFWFYVNEEN